MWLMLVQIGQSCSNAHSRLISSLPSTGQTVYRHLQFLSTGAVWLGCPGMGAWLGIFCSTPQIHIFLVTLIVLLARIGRTSCFLPLQSGKVIYSPTNLSSTISGMIRYRKSRKIIRLFFKILQSFFCLKLDLALQENLI